MEIIVAIILIIVMVAFIHHLVSSGRRYSVSESTTYTKVKILCNEYPELLQQDLNDFLSDIKDAGAWIEDVAVAQNSSCWSAVVIYKVIVVKK